MFKTSRCAFSQADGRGTLETQVWGRSPALGGAAETVPSAASPLRCFRSESTPAQVPPQLPGGMPRFQGEGRWCSGGELIPCLAGLCHSGHRCGLRKGPSYSVLMSAPKWHLPWKSQPVSGTGIYSSGDEGPVPSQDLWGPLATFPLGHTQAQAARDWPWEVSKPGRLPLNSSAPL